MEMKQTGHEEQRRVESTNDAIPASLPSSVGTHVLVNRYQKGFLQDTRTCRTTEPG